jgi:hypothetical protein
VLRAEQHQVAVIDGCGQVTAAHLDAIDHAGHIQLDDFTVPVQRGSATARQLIEVDAQLRAVHLQKAMDSSVGRRLDFARVRRWVLAQVRPTQPVAGTAAGDQRLGHDQRRPAPAAPVDAAVLCADAECVEVSPRVGRSLVRQVRRQAVLVIDRQRIEMKLCLTDTGFVRFDLGGNVACKQKSGKSEENYPETGQPDGGHS